MKTIPITKAVIAKARAAEKSIKDWDKTRILVALLEFLKDCCPVTETDDVLAVTTREKLTNKVYTKKICLSVPHEVEKSFNSASDTALMEIVKNIEYISVSSPSEDFSGCMTSDIRVNFKNKYNEWANTFASSLGIDYLRFLYCLALEVSGNSISPDALGDKYVELCELADTLAIKNITDPSTFIEAVDLLKKSCS